MLIILFSQHTQTLHPSLHSIYFIIRKNRDIHPLTLRELIHWTQKQRTFIIDHRRTCACKLLIISQMHAHYAPLPPHRSLHSSFTIVRTAQTEDIHPRTFLEHHPPPSITTVSPQSLTSRSSPLFPSVLPSSTVQQSLSFFKLLPRGL